jgi:phosphomannomutase
MLMVDISGIRGQVGSTFTPDIVARFASAFASLTGMKSCLVGCDTRRSSEMVKFSAISGLLAAGCGVVDVGVVCTPTAQVATEKLSMDGAVVVSASHNPEDWNALKLLGPDGIYLDAERMAALRALFADPARIRYAVTDRLRDCSIFQGAERLHINAVLAGVDRAAIRARGYRVGVDASGGAGARIARDLLEELGCEVIVVHPAQGVFYFPENRATHFAQLSRAVRDLGLDVGFGLDPDGDRLTVVTDVGEVLLEEKTLALAVAYRLERDPGPVVTNQSTTMAIDEIAAARGVKVYRAKVGEVYVTTKMKDVGAVVGGEGNGGVVFPEVHYGRDAVAGMGHLLNYAAAAGARFSALAAALPRTFMDKVSVPIEGIEPALAYARIASALGGRRDEDAEGLRLVFSDGWLHVRPSRTEPLLRIYGETRDGNRLAAMLDGARAAVKAG